MDSQHEGEVDDEEDKFNHDLELAIAESIRDIENWGQEAMRCEIDPATLRSPHEDSLERKQESRNKFKKPS